MPLRSQLTSLLETLHDLLDIYHPPLLSNTELSHIPLDTFLQIRIPLNTECDERKLPRYTEYIDVHPPSHPLSNAPGYTNGVNGTSIPTGPAAGRGRGQTVSPQNQLTSPSTNSTAPGSGSTNTTLDRPAGSAGIAGRDAAGVRQRIGERGRDGTVRFLLNPDREKEERAARAEYGDEG